MNYNEQIVEVIGKDTFQWLSKEFNKTTTLKDFPGETLGRIASVDITIKNYAGDKNAVTSIAIITFAYKMADKIQIASFGAKDILLLKVLAKNERLRRTGENCIQHKILDVPFFELITGSVGERIRVMRTINSPF
jgi:hypothetical protein